MTKQHAYSSYNTKQTPQNQPIPGKDMIKMRSGGYGFKVGDWEQLRRFLILGTIGGTYYASEQSLTKECAEVILRCLNEDPIKTVNMIIDVSVKGLALKNDHALFALALAASHVIVGNFALNIGLPQVARTGTHLFMFLTFVQQFRGWGRSLKSAVADWYNEKDRNKLAYQVVKYRQRDGWTHRDVLRKCHAKPKDAGHNMLYGWITQGQVPENWEYMPQVLQGFLNVQQAVNADHAAEIVTAFNLPREAVPTQFLNSEAVWTALLQKMPMTAMVRNLGVMTANGTLKPFNENVNLVVNVLRNPEAISRSRIHPIQVLFALKTYAHGQGFRGNKTWSPISQIVDALDDAYYLSFDNIPQTTKNIVIGVDMSGSMKGGYGQIMQPCEFAGAMAMTTIKGATNVVVKGFDHRLWDTPLSPKMRLDQVMSYLGKTGGGMTDASLPIKWAANNGIPVDAFIIYSDGESWYGDQHPSQALEVYRRVMNRPNTKMVVVHFTPTAYGLNDPFDPNCLNVVGNSPDVAQAINSFLEE